MDAFLDPDVEALVTFGARIATETLQARETRLTEEEALFLFNRSKVTSGVICILDMKTRFDKTVSASTVSRYKTMLAFRFDTPGRPPLLSPEMSAKLDCVLRRLRERSYPICAAFVVAVATGLLERNAPGITVSSGGPIKLSIAWAQDWLTANKYKYRAATTDRTVSPKQIVDSGNKLFSDLQELQAVHLFERSDVYNVDEFFMRFEEASRTWEVVNDGRQNIAIKSSKMGFTCSVTSSSDGSLVLLQLIYKGTSRIFVPGIDDDRQDVLQCSNAETHFQTGASWAEWKKRFLDIAKKRSPGRKILLCLDQARQHSPIDDDSVVTMHLPAAQTHVFQPADMYIISNIKNEAAKYYNSIVVELFTRHEVSDAVQGITASSVTWNRERCAKALVHAFDELGRDSVLKSWNVTGIVGALFNEVHETQFDIYKEILAASGDVECDVVPVPLAEIDQADQPQDARPPEDQSRKRGRPPMSAEERTKRAKEHMDKVAADKKLKSLPLAQRRLAESAKHMRPLTGFLTPRADGK